MRIKKTRQCEREVYRYPLSIEDGCGGYKNGYIILRPGVDGVTEEMIKLLHAMDDSEVYNNVKNGHPQISGKQRGDKKEWEPNHPGEKYMMNWNLSLDYVFENLDDKSTDKSLVLSKASYNPFEDVSDQIERLREIVDEKMTERQREAYKLIGILGYSRTEAAQIMKVSIKVAKTHYDKAIDCIRKNF